MDRKSAEQLVSDLYEHALRRIPPVEERDRWVETVIAGMRPEAVVRAFYLSAEFRSKNAVKSIFPTGHYHSPVVDPTTVGSYVKREREQKPTELLGIWLDVDAMRRTWVDHLEFIQCTPFTDEPTSLNRYNYLGGPYPWGDAITLRMMIKHYRPRHVIEIGSGYSSACMLDSVEHVGLADFKLTCIEPYPDRLRSLLRADDKKIVTLIEKTIQDVDETIVDTLEPNDILFIDSTHVLKTGSDVHYELFHLLPRVKPGVIIHIHDVAYPFEYPDKWIYEDNYSWNEAYALRAFLVFNNEFRITFWNSLYARLYRDDINVEFPAFLRNPGTSIWIERR